MRYFIGHLIRGEAAEYYKTTCADLAARFGVEDVSAIVPPHITVKTPFEQPNSDAVEEIVAGLAEASAIPFAFSGWNHFGTRTIFVDTPQPPAELKSFLKEVLNKMRQNGFNLTSQEVDPHIHMSVARFLKYPQYNEIWKYLSGTPAPKFDLNFDNLTIFVKENRDDKAWKVLKTFPMVGKRSE